MVMYEQTLDFSPLKPALIQGKQQRRVSRLVPFGFGRRSE